MDQKFQKYESAAGNAPSRMMLTLGSEKLGSVDRKSGHRRVLTEGVEMLENKYSVIEEKMKLQSIENRVKRLEFEE